MIGGSALSLKFLTNNLQTRESLMKVKYPDLGMALAESTACLSRVPESISVLKHQLDLELEFTMATLLPPGSSPISPRTGPGTL